MGVELSRAEVATLLEQVPPEELFDVLQRYLSTKRKPEEMPPHCPSCGYSLRYDYILHEGGFEIDPRGTVKWDGVDLGFTPKQVSIFHSIALNKGRFVTVEALTARYCNEVKGWPPKTVHVHVHNIRKKLAAAGAPDPLFNPKGKGSVSGYRWTL